MQHRFTTAFLDKLAQALCLSALALVPCQKAQASGFAVPALGPTNMGISTPGPLSVHLNPAGLGFAEQARFIAGGDLLIGNIKYTRDYRATYQRSDSLDFNLPIDPSAVDPAKSGFAEEVSTTPVGVVPSVFTEVPLADLPLALGFGVDVPYAAIVNWPGSGPQRFALDHATLATVFVNAGIAYRPIKRLSIGVGASWVIGYADLSRVQDLATVDELGDALGRPPISQANGFGTDADPALRELDTFARRFDFNNGWANGATFRAGLMAEPIDNLFLSASYEYTTKLNFRGNFTLDMNDPFFTQDLASQGLQYPAMVGGDASLSFKLPQVVRLGVSYGFGHNVRGQPKSSIALEGTYTGWSSVNDFDVRLSSPELAQPELGLGTTLRLLLPRRWHDTYGGLARFTHAATDKVGLWISGGGESAAVPDSTIDAASPDGVRITGSGGLAIRIAGDIRVLLDLTIQGVLERNVVNSDYDIGNGTYKMMLYSGGAYLDVAL